ncbi:surface antigen (D15) [Pelobacter propionicus DSM 2379]|uniref:Translocation and assembly module subunit TamA n=1 Tax=Pelobacter propionicus (strain DSM 2379 / NBRC 103807 / OttBd1) TaxID=338966 RepID=A1AU38_PELPD|nr:surface antigen (D15) [Pelobacter propionicus DSM 2379]
MILNPAVSTLIRSLVSLVSRFIPLARRCVTQAFRVALLGLFLAPPLFASPAVEVVVSGIEGEARENVRQWLALPDELAAGDSVDRLWLERFARQAVDRAKTALEPFGYYNARVTVSLEESQDTLRLLVRVVPGEAVRLSEVRVSVTGPGGGERRLRRLVDTFPLKKGDVLLHQKYEEAKAALLSRAQELGYLDAAYGRHEIRIEESATSAVIHLALDTGGKYAFGETSIQGAPDYPDGFLRRHLNYGAGEVFSHSRLGETQRNFTNSERFRDVLVTAGTADRATQRVPIVVQLKEAPRITLRPGVGYGTDTGGRFTLRYRDLNLFHLGHELNSQLYLAERLQGLVIGYVRPSPRDIRSATTLQLNVQQEDTDSYFSRILAMELARTHGFGRGILGTAYIRGQYEDYEVGDQDDSARLLLPGLRLSVDRYDNPLRPRRGYRYGLELRGTHRLLGSDTELVQFLVGGSHVLALPGRFSLRTRADGGTTLLSDHMRAIPPSLRFFAGGDRSVRGYSYKSLGPRDSSGDVVGGRQMLVGSVELERALFQSWGLSVFFDAGNAFDSLGSLKLYQGAGFGLHYYSPVGALNLSLARPLNGRSSSLHVHFTVGFEL